MPSGIAISAVVGTVNPACLASVKPIHSTSGKASKPLVPAGFRMCVNGVPMLGESLPSGSSVNGRLPTEYGRSGAGPPAAGTGSGVATAGPQPASSAVISAATSRCPLTPAR